jgi:hypothetical protein
MANNCGCSPNYESTVANCSSTRTRQALYMRHRERRQYFTESSDVILFFWTRLCPQTVLMSTAVKEYSALLSKNSFLRIISPWLRGGIRLSSLTSCLRADCRIARCTEYLYRIARETSQEYKLGMRLVSHNIWLEHTNTFVDRLAIPNSYACCYCSSARAELGLAWAYRVL